MQLTNCKSVVVLRWLAGIHFVLLKIMSCRLFRRCQQSHDFSIILWAPLRTENTLKIVISYIFFSLVNAITIIFKLEFMDRGYLYSRINDLKCTSELNKMNSYLAPIYLRWTFYQWNETNPSVLSNCTWMSGRLGLVTQDIIW